MPDWPNSLWCPPAGSICSASIQSAGQISIPLGGATSLAAVWPAANRAIYIPFMVETTVTAYQMAVIVSVQSGNLDAGIYDVLGNRLVSMGSTAVAAAGVQLLNIADTVLTPGVYFMALCVDNITASLNRMNIDTLSWQTFGVQQQAVGAVTLPNPAVFANPASGIIPVLSVALTATM